MESVNEELNIYSEEVKDVLSNPVTVPLKAKVSARLTAGDFILDKDVPTSPKAILIPYCLHP